MASPSPAGASSGPPRPAIVFRFENPGSAHFEYSPGGASIEQISLAADYLRGIADLGIQRRILAAERELKSRQIQVPGRRQ